MPTATQSRRRSVTVSSTLKDYKVTPYKQPTRTPHIDDVRTNFSLCANYSPSSKSTILVSTSEKESAIKAASLRAMQAEHKHYSRNRKAVAKEKFELDVQKEQKGHIFSVKEVQEKAELDYLMTLAPPPPPPPPPPPALPIDSEFKSDLNEYITKLESKSKSNIFDAVTMPWEKTEKSTVTNKTKSSDIDERLSVKKKYLEKLIEQNKRTLLNPKTLAEVANESHGLATPLSPSSGSPHMHHRHATSPAGLASHTMNAYNQQQLQQGESKQTKQMKVSLNQKRRSEHRDHWYMEHCS